MVENSARTLVVFLTMHRSGSSVATSIFYRLGMSLGPFELLDSSPSNPNGHFEAVPILNLNKDVQRFVYGFDEDLPESEEAIDKFVALQGHADWPDLPDEFLRRGRAMIECLIDSAPVSGFKDPRTVLLWPFWSRVLADFPELRVVTLPLLRSPHAIAMSLCSRSLTTGGIYAYWDCLDMAAIHYNLMKSILDACQTRPPRVRFGIPQFLGDLEHAVRYCDLSWDANVATQMIDPSYIHHVTARVRHEAQELYDDLCGECPLCDTHANEARLNADLRLSERLAWLQVAVSWNRPGTSSIKLVSNSTTHANKWTRLASSSWGRTSSCMPFARISRTRRNTPRA